MAVTALPLVLQNKNDSEILNSLRLIAHGYLAKAVANSNTEIRLKYLSYVEEQATLVAKFNNDICYKYLKSQVDITKILPSDFVKKELDIFDEALSSSFQKPKNFSQSKYENAMQVIGSKMDVEELKALQNPDIKNGSLNCSASKNFYKQINLLNPVDKDIIIYAMYNNL